MLRLSDSVADLLPDKLPKKPDPMLAELTVEDLLTMRSGLDPASDRPHEAGRDWARYALSQPFAWKPGTHFHYNSMNTYLCSMIVQRKTMISVNEYLKPRLFYPLGIHNPVWDNCPMGVNCGGWGLYLTAMDIAKFGQLLLQDGLWEGKRILPEGWVERATSKHADNSHHSQAPEWREGYGYQFWRCRNGHYRGDGMLGQMCWVMPEQKAVLAITAGSNAMDVEANCIVEHLVPAIDRPSDGSAWPRLLERLDTLAHLPPQGERPPESILREYAGPKGAGFSLSPTPEGNILLRTKAFAIPLGVGRYEDAMITVHHQWLQGWYQTRSACAWQGGALSMIARIPGLPHTQRMTLRPEGDHCVLEGENMLLPTGVYQPKQ
ncbi:MAG TPA: serine hydrolase [Clostridia bacterium]|nr:serine hydrolase [Clostridia bacterium]